MAKKNSFKENLNKSFGEGTIFAFDDDSAQVSVTPISTGIPSMDYASGIGGLPMGRIVEMYGLESSGKTTIALKVIAEAQKLAKTKDHPMFNKEVLFIDAEHAIDPIHAQALGVQLAGDNRMWINQPDSGEQIFDLIDTAASSGEVGLVVVDSVAAISSKKEGEESMDYNPIGLQARLMSQGLRKVNGPIKKANMLVIFINQIRMKMTMYGDPKTTPGGQALRFYSSQRIEVKRKEIKKSDRILGQEITVAFKKNKVARPFTDATFDYYWDTGIDAIKDIMNVAIDMSIVGKAGSWYYIGPSNKEPYKDGGGNELKWQGKQALEDTLKASPALFDYINDMVQGRIPKDSQFVEENDIDEPSDYDSKEEHKEEQEEEQTEEQQSLDI